MEPINKVELTGKIISYTSQVGGTTKSCEYQLELCTNSPSCIPVWYLSETPASFIYAGANIHVFGRIYKGPKGDIFVNANKIEALCS